jgi:hypothetical protein
MGGRGAGPSILNGLTPWLATTSPTPPLRRQACSDLCAKFGGAEAAALQQAILWTERRALVPGLPAAASARADALERAHRIAWAALSALPLASESVRGTGGASVALTRVHPRHLVALRTLTTWAPVCIRCRCHPPDALRPPPSALCCPPPQELNQLLRCRLAAMAATSTLDRLQLASSCLESARSMLAARVALKSLNMGAS